MLWAVFVRVVFLLAVLGTLYAIMTTEKGPAAAEPEYKTTMMFVNPANGYVEAMLAASHRAAPRPERCPVILRELRKSWMTSSSFCRALFLNPAMAPRHLAEERRMPRATWQQTAPSALQTRHHRKPPIAGPTETLGSCRGREPPAAGSRSNDPGS
jgi:hypothetical protein